jgi:two-component system response regulator PfeR
LLRRIQVNAVVSNHSVAIDDLLLTLDTSRASIKHTPLDLTLIQFKLLWELAHHRGEVLSKAYLSQQVLNRTLGAYDRSLDMHLSRVRRKLNDAGWRGDRLQTVHGKGYCLK